MESANKNNSATFSDARFVTSTEDLRKILSKCPSCYNLTLNGSLILSVDSLEGLKLPTSKQSRFFLYVNILTAEKTVGHWIGFCCDTEKSVCFVIDPANRFHEHQDTLTRVKQFCQLNKLQMFNYAVKFQLEASFICGQLCCFFCAKFHSLSSFRELLELRDVIKSYTIEFNERHMVSYIQKHYATSL